MEDTTTETQELEQPILQPDKEDVIDLVIGPEPSGKMEYPDMEERPVPQQEGATPGIRIRKMPNNLKDPLVSGFVFKVGDWAYRVYETKSRGRKLIKRMGVVEYER
uniref:Uncharacterized protein n=1 Tax=viral metagenome TaxID=1070528 RepID=A0A6M3IKA7_9ZZZZ